MNARLPSTLQGLRVLITGGAQGLGAATGVALARAGATVVVGDVNTEGARRQANALGESASFVTLDVGDAAQVEAAMSAIQNRLGGLDAVINNAAVDFTLSL